MPRAVCDSDNEYYLQCRILVLVVHLATGGHRLPGGARKVCTDHVPELSLGNRGGLVVRVNIVETMALFIGCYIFLEHILATPSLVDDEIITLHSHTNTLISTFLVIEH